MQAGQFSWPSGISGQLPANPDGGLVSGLSMHQD